MIYARRSQLRVPATIPVINRSHPLAQGLVGCWLPGVAGPFDLSGFGPNFTPQSAASWSTTGEGAGLNSRASTSGYTSTFVPSGLKAYSQLTLYWRGYTFGTAPGFSCLIGISYTTTDSTPYRVASIEGDATGPPQKWQAAWNFGGTARTSFGDSAVTDAQQFLSIGATFVVAGNVLVYSNGVVAAPGNPTAFGGSTPTSVNSTLNLSAWSPVVTRNPNGVCNAGYIWNRALSGAEMLWLHEEPYSFLMKRSDLINPFKKPSAAPPVTSVFRKTASRIGTRIGSRQTWAA